MLDELIMNCYDNEEDPQVLYGCKLGGKSSVAEFSASSDD